MRRLHNRALVDISGFGKTINDIQGSFSTLEFFDFCTTIEGIILYDKLVPVGSMRVPEKWQEHYDFLKKNGVITDAIVDAPLADVGPRPAQQYGQNDRFRAAQSSLVDSWYESGRLLGAERQSGISALPLVRQRPIYETFGVVREEHSVCCLITQYKELSEAVQEIRRQNRLKLVPYVVLPIPPIPLIVIQRSQKKGEFLTRTLELRDEFSKLRNSLRELRAVLADPDVTPKEKLRFRQSWERSWATLQKYKDGALSVDLAETTRDKISIERSLDGVSIDSLQLTKLLEVLIREASRLFHSRRVRVLHNTARKYLSTSDFGLNREISRLYGYEVTHRDIELLEQFGINGR